MELSQLRFVVDENTLAVGKIMQQLRDNVAYVGDPLIYDLIPRRSLDQHWIPVAAEHGWVAITNDHHMRTRYYEASLALEHGLMVVNIKGVGHRTAWDQLVRLTKHWQSVRGRDLLGRRLRSEHEMMTTLRRWYYRLRSPPENPDLLGRRVHRGTRINGVWKYNQQHGVIVNSWADVERRMYRIQLDGISGVVSTTLPIDEYLITNERVDVSGIVIDPELGETRLARGGGWYGVGTEYSDYYRPRTPWGWLAHKARGWYLGSRFDPRR